MTDAPPFTFLWQEQESPGLRIVRCCESVLANGPIGDKEQGGLYRYFVGCGDPKHAVKGGGDIGTIRTSCAVFAGAVLYWCGSPDREILRPGVAGWPMFGGWLGSLSKRHPAWVHWTGAEQPEQGSLFFIEHPGTNNNHVGFLLRETEPGKWETAEGGGGDGTRCKISERVLTDFDNSTIYDFDPRLKRKLQGWFVPSRLGLVDT